MAITNLSCANIGDLDEGAAGLVINAAINEAVSDLEDRGSDGKPRKVVVTLELVLPDEGQGSPIVHVEACAKIPARRTRRTSGKLLVAGKQPVFSFSELDRDDPTQTTIDQYTDRKPKE